MTREPDRYALIREFVDVDAVLESLGIEGTTKGDELEASCPLPSHSGADASPSFYFNKEKRVYVCFGCDASGSLPLLVQNLRGGGYEEAVAWLYTFSSGEFGDDKTFVELILRRLTENETDESAKHILPHYRESVYAPWEVPCEYWSTRGLNEDTVRLFHLGYDPKHRRSEHKYVGPAVIVPHFLDERCVGYQERWLEDGRPFKSKWTNTRNFPKSETLFNWDRASVSDVPRVVVVESAITAIYLHQHGVEAVATFGAKIGDRQLEYMKALPGALVLSFDNDDAGEKATQRVIDALDDTKDVYYLEPVPGHKADLNDLAEDRLFAHLSKTHPAFLYRFREEVN